MEANKVRFPKEFMRISCISSLFPKIFIGCRVWVAS
jgi:putative transposon-encoded protein